MVEANVRQKFLVSAGSDRMSSRPATPPEAQEEYRKYIGDDKKPAPTEKSKTGDEKRPATSPRATTPRSPHAVKSKRRRQKPAQMPKFDDEKKPAPVNPRATTPNPSLMKPKFDEKNPAPRDNKPKIDEKSRARRQAKIDDARSPPHRQAHK